MDAPHITGCRSISQYEKLNRIDEGTYGVVYRARDINTNEIVALKRLKIIKDSEGFPVTSLREIHTLLIAKHPNIVNVREIVAGPELNSIYIVMDFVEHDLKALMADMPTPFLHSEIKTIMLQLLSAVALLHDHWIVHRDLKTSNLLLSNRGEIKVADFGLARKFGSPLGYMTQLVVTLWYRAPELLLATKDYSTAIDIWSIGCIFGELINNEPLMPGQGEIDQLKKIFQLLGTPSDSNWPGYSLLPNASKFSFKSQPWVKFIYAPQFIWLGFCINWYGSRYNNLRSRFPYLTKAGLDLLGQLLALDPAQRISAREALEHPYFSEAPAPKDPSMFPTWPSKGSGEKRKNYKSPSAPHAHIFDDAENDKTGEGGSHVGARASDETNNEENSIFDMQSDESGATGFRLRI